MPKGRKRKGRRIFTKRSGKNETECVGCKERKLKSLEHKERNAIRENKMKLQRNSQPKVCWVKKKASLGVVYISMEL